LENYLKIMGALFQNVCYPTQEMARVSACSGSHSQSLIGTDVFTSECTSSDFTGATMELCKRTNGGACVTVTSPWPSTPLCDHAGGVTLSYDYFLVALAFLCVVWGGKQLIKLFDHHHADS
jgi:hypothetical protein